MILDIAPIIFMAFICFCAWKLNNAFIRYADAATKAQQAQEKANMAQKSAWDRDGGDDGEAWKRGGQ